jgi:hypothetical protein
LDRLRRDPNIHTSNANMSHKYAAKILITPEMRAREVASTTSA